MIKKLENIDELKEALKEAEEKYKYQEKLTDELDGNKDGFTECHFLKIMLWKLNRYPEIQSDTIRILNKLKKSYTEESAKLCLAHLLQIKGCDLPMASTILRFLMPEKFQIIDQRAYRILYGEELKMSTLKDKKIEIYFKYLFKLREETIRFNISFEKADRLLYSLDRIVNKNLPLKNYSAKIKD